MNLDTVDFHPILLDAAKLPKGYNQDPKTRLKGLPDALQHVVVIKPAPPTLAISGRHMQLYGDQLSTLQLNAIAETFGEQQSGRAWMDIAPVGGRKLGTVELTNIGGKNATVLMCESADPQYGCSAQTTTLTLPPFGNDSYSLAAAVFHYLLFAKPKDVFVEGYQVGVGDVSTFEVNSGVTFGDPTEKKDKQ